MFSKLIVILGMNLHWSQDDLVILFEDMLLGHLLFSSFGPVFHGQVVFDFSALVWKMQHNSFIFELWSCLLEMEFLVGVMVGMFLKLRVVGGASFGLVLTMCLKMQTLLQWYEFIQIQ